MIDSKHLNILPYDGHVYYQENFIETTKSEQFLKNLMMDSIWKHDEIILFGKKIYTKRKVAFEGNEGISYKYSNQKKIANPWTKTVLEIKNILESEFQMKFNGCLLNLYNNGNENMGWHSDNEPDLDADGFIASLSFGAERIFQFKHKKNNNQLEIKLRNGSLLIMNMETQKKWLHQLKKESKISEKRINLTFRLFKS